MSSGTAAAASKLDGISRVMDKTLSYVVAVLLVAMSFTVFGNVVPDNTRSGIVTGMDGDLNTIQQNAVFHNRRDGLWLAGSSNSSGAAA